MKYFYHFLCTLAICLSCIPLQAKAESLSFFSYQVEVTYPSVDGIAPPVPVSGVELSVYRVAELNKEENYVLLPDYQQLDISGLTEMNADELEEEAQKFSSLTEQQDITPDFTAITDENGIVLFQNIEEPGLYLTKHTGKTGEAEKYSAISPYLIQIPYFDHAVGWIYDVVTEPKLKLSGEFETENPTEPETTVRKTTTPAVTSTTTPTTVNAVQNPATPKTGDEEQLSFWIAIFVISLSGFLLMLGTRSKTSGSQEKS